MPTTPLPFHEIGVFLLTITSTTSRIKGKYTMRKYINRIFNFSSITTSFLIIFSSLNLEAINPNKEVFQPDPAIFSSSPAIDYEGIETHIHYKFKNRDLLRDALHPMLPRGLVSNSTTFDQLEFSGDSVLGSIIRKRLIHLFPTQNRGDLTQIYNLITCNKNLTVQFLFQLDLEKFLPLPTQGYKICNVVEALIGAIDEDDPVNGMTNATRFVLRLMDDELFNKKLRAFANQKKVVFNHQMLPDQNKTVASLCTPQRVQAKGSSKTILNELLLKLFDDRPEYVTTITINDNGDIFYQTIVIGSQIGSQNIGYGNTVIEAEANAAKAAVNKLAQAEVYSLEPLQPNERKYRSQLDELSKFLKIKLIHTSSGTNYDVLQNGVFIGQGKGKNLKESTEIASKEACAHLARNEMDRINIRQEKRLEQWNLHILDRLHKVEMSRRKIEFNQFAKNKLSKNKDTKQLLSSWVQNHISQLQGPNNPSMPVSNTPTVKAHTPAQPSKAPKPKKAKALEGSSPKKVTAVPAPAKASAPVPPKKKTKHTPKESTKENVSKKTGAISHPKQKETVTKPKGTGKKDLKVGLQI